MVQVFRASEGRSTGPTSATAAKHCAAVIAFEDFERAFRNTVAGRTALHRSHTYLFLSPLGTIYQLRNRLLAPGLLTFISSPGENPDWVGGLSRSVAYPRRGRLSCDHADHSAPAWVNFTNVPLSCSSIQPMSIANLSPAPYSAGDALSPNKNGPLHRTSPP